MQSNVCHGMVLNLLESLTSLSAFKSPPNLPKPLLWIFGKDKLQATSRVDMRLEYHVNKCHSTIEMTRMLANYFKAAALYCLSQGVCATNSLGGMGCCYSEGLDNCLLPTACIDSTALGHYGSSYLANPYVTSWYVI